MSPRNAPNFRKHARCRSNFSLSRRWTTLTNWRSVPPIMKTLRNFSSLILSFIEMSCGDHGSLGHAGSSSGIARAFVQKTAAPEFERDHCPEPQIHAAAAGIELKNSFYVAGIDDSPITTCFRQQQLVHET